MIILNYKTLDRIQQLRESVEQKDRELIKLDKKIKGIALEDGWQIQMDLHITEPVRVKDEPYKDSYEQAEERWLSLGKTEIGGSEAEEFIGKYPQGGFMSGIFNALQTSSEQLSGITVRAQTALKMLLIYREDLEAERACIYKALEEAVKSLM